MNNIVTLEDAKKHLNVDFDDDNGYISTLIEVATERIESHLDIKFDDVFDDTDSIPKSIKHAILLLIGELYKNRELTTENSVNELPFTINYLLTNYKNYSY